MDHMDYMRTMGTMDAMDTVGCRLQILSFYSFLWMPVDNHGCPRIPMESCGCPRIPTESHGEPTDSDGEPWIAMDSFIHMTWCWWQHTLSTCLFVMTQCQDAPSFSSELEEVNSDPRFQLINLGPSQCAYSNLELKTCYKIIENCSMSTGKYYFMSHV